jgi:hypothetical protein
MIKGAGELCDLLDECGWPPGTKHNHHGAVPHRNQLHDAHFAHPCAKLKTG